MAAYHKMRNISWQALT